MTKYLELSDNETMHNVWEIHFLKPIDKKKDQKHELNIQHKT